MSDYGTFQHISETLRDIPGLQGVFTQPLPETECPYLKVHFEEIQQDHYLMPRKVTVTAELSIITNVTGEKQILEICKEITERLAKGNMPCRQLRHHHKTLKDGIGRQCAMTYQFLVRL
jgi:hypothetical protein